MDKHGFTKLTMAHIGGKPPPPHYSILCAWPWAQHPNVICPDTFKFGVLKFSKLGLLQLWRLIILCVNLWLKWGMKEKFSHFWDLSNGMWHATCMQGNQGDSWLLVVKSQINNLTFSPSFGHNLCFKYPNGSCELILDIYVSKKIQWYKENFNPMNFDLAIAF